MSGEITPWLFEEKHLLRSITHADDPAWFAGPDLAQILGYRDATNALRGLDDDEKGTHILSTLGGDQEIKVVSEPGLYRCILQRREVTKLDPEVRERIARFQRWVFHDVLPAIRKTGRYDAGVAPQPHPSEPTRPFDEWTPAELNSKVGAVAEYRMSVNPQAGQWAMQRMGFPMPPTYLTRPRQYELDLTANA